jgi:polyhydroxyalkanoate synthesis regulator phasin
MNEQRIIEQLDAMVASGRITQEEAGALRAAEGTPQFGVVVGAIRARHARAHLQAAVAAGEMSQAEADANVAQLRRGEHPDGLRAKVRLHRSPSPGGP